MEEFIDIPKINVVLDKKDLISLVKGTSPNYHVMNHVGNLGELNGSYDTWSWNKDKLEKLTAQELHEIYQICKQSWDNDISYKVNIKDSSNENRISLLQYINLRKHFQELIRDVFGPNYYNEGMDVYTTDEFSCRDLKKKLKG